MVQPCNGAPLPREGPSQLIAAKVPAATENTGALCRTADSIEQYVPAATIRIGYGDRGA
jgi:hypothetical protein